MAIVGRVLEAQGFRVGIIAQPDWHSTRDFLKLGEPNLFFGITGGNMDSMVNRYTADRRIRSDDAYTPHGVAGARPDRCVIVYAQRVREAYKDVPLVVGGIEASLRRIAHFDYWSEKVRRSVLLDAKADLLVYGNAERQICEIAHRLARGRADPRHPRPARHGVRAPRHAGGLDRDRLDHRRHARAHRSPDRPVRDGDRDASLSGIVRRGPRAARSGNGRVHVVVKFYRKVPNADRARSVVRMPSFEQVAARSGALRARLAHPAPGVEPGQRARARAAPRRRRRVAQPAADPAHHQGDGRRLRAALPAGAASVLRRGEDPGLRDDPVLGRDPARLLRRLHVLLDHRARGPDHPEPLGGLGDPRDRDDARHGARASPA